jgi:hypothetical protein
VISRLIAFGLAGYCDYVDVTQELMEVGFKQLGIRLD